MFDENKPYSYYTRYDVIEDMLQHGDIPRNCRPVPCTYEMMPIMFSCVMDSIRQLMTYDRLRPVKITVYNELEEEGLREYESDTFDIYNGTISCLYDKYFPYSGALSMQVSNDYSQVNIHCIYNTKYSVSILLEFDNTNMYAELSE